MSSTSNIQNLLVNVFRPVYTYDSNTGLFTTSVQLANVAYSGTTLSVSNIAVGDDNQNVYIGSNAGNAYTNLQACDNNTAVGYSAGGAISNVSNSTYLGYNAGNAASNASNVIAIGSNAGGNGTTNIFVGNNTGSLGSNNILLGHGIVANGSNNLLQIGTNIYGNTSTRWVGIGTSTPTISNNFDISGNARVSGTLKAGAFDVSAIAADDLVVPGFIRNSVVPSLLDISGGNISNSGTITTSNALLSGYLRGSLPRDTFTVAVGEGTNDIAYSSDGITWTTPVASPFTTRGNGVAWNGSLWVAVGTGTSNTIATSSNGIDWVGQSNTTFTTQGLGVAWNGSLWVAVGQGGNTIATSSNGITWVAQSNPLSVGRGIAWNGSLWVAVGRFGALGAIVTSPDGSNWTGVTSPFTSIVNRVAWNGSLWVAVGGGTNTIATSSDGSNWTGQGSTIFGIEGYDVAWNGSLWVAVGGPTSTIATSPDGSNWTVRDPSLSTIFSSSGNGVAWNGSLWVAVGSGTSNTIATSPNGITWTGRGKTTFTTQGWGAASRRHVLPLIDSTLLDASSGNIEYTGSIIGSNAGSTNRIGGVTLSNSNITTTSGTITTSNGIVSGYLRNALTPTQFDISGGNISNSAVHTTTGLVGTYLRNALTPTTYDISGGNISNSAVHTTTGLVGTYLRNALTPTTYDISGGNISNSLTTRSSNFITATASSNSIGGTVLSNSRIGIGTTAQTAILDVSGSIVGNTNVRVQNNVGEVNLRLIAGNFSDGSAITLFQNSIEQGIYSSNTLPLYLNTAGIRRLTILSNGNVGINNTNPQQSLDVNGIINSANLLVNGYLRNALNPNEFDISGGNIRNSGTTSSVNMLASGYLRNALIPTQFDISGGNISNSGTHTSTNILSSGYLRNALTPSQFDISGGNQMLKGALFLDSTDTAKIHFLADVTRGVLGPRITHSGGFTLNFFAGHTSNNNEGNFTFNRASSSAAAGFIESMRITNLGRVGIGNILPSTTLDISTGSNPGVTLRTNSLQTAFRVIGNGVADGNGMNLYQSDVDQGIYQQNLLPLQFWTNGVRRMTINSNGFVGIGTTGPGKLMDISSGTSGEGVRVTAPNATVLVRASTASNGLQLYSSSDSTQGLFTLGSKIQVSTNGSTGDSGLIVSANQVGIGRANPAYLLDVSGTFAANTSEYTTYVTSNTSLSSPNGFTKAFITLCGGGGGGSGGAGELSGVINGQAGAGGGSGWIVEQLITSVPATLTITIGAGGSGTAGVVGGASSSSATASSGVASTVTGTNVNMFAPGGTGGTSAGNGGSGSAGNGGEGYYGGGGGGSSNAGGTGGSQSATGRGRTVVWGGDRNVLIGGRGGGNNTTTSSTGGYSGGSGGGPTGGAGGSPGGAGLQGTLGGGGGGGGVLLTSGATGGNGVGGGSGYCIVRFLR